MKQDVSKLWFKERMRLYRKGIIGGIILVAVLLVASYSASRIAGPGLNQDPGATDQDTNLPDQTTTSDTTVTTSTDGGDTNPPPDDGDNTKQFSLLQLSTTIKEKYAEIAMIRIYQNISTSTGVYMRTSEFLRKQTNWVANVYVFEVDGENFTESSYSVTANESDMQELNDRIVSGVNASTVIDQNSTGTYDPLLSSVYIMIAYEDNTGITFYWQQDDVNSFVYYVEFNWTGRADLGSNYMDINYLDETTQYLTPQSVFEPVLTKVNEILS